MLTIQRTRGVAGPSEAIAVIGRAALGGYENTGSQLADRPPIVCEVWPGGSLPVATTLPAAWPDDTTDYVLVDFPLGAMSSLSTGRYPGRIRLDGDGGIETQKFCIAMNPGPGDASLRPAYHLYDDMLREQPMIERYEDELRDQTGFAATAADARNWIDVKILKASCRSRWCGMTRCGSPSMTYVEALAAGHLVLDDPGGSQVVMASIYRTLSVLMRRIEGMSNAPDDIRDLRAEYQAWADEAIEDVTLTFAEETGLAPVRTGGMPIGRVTR